MGYECEIFVLSAAVKQLRLNACLTVPFDPVVLRHWSNISRPRNEIFCRNIFFKNFVFFSLLLGKLENILLLSCKDQSYMTSMNMNLSFQLTFNFSTPSFNTFGSVSMYRTCGVPIYGQRSSKTETEILCVRCGDRTTEGRNKKELEYRANHSI